MRILGAALAATIASASAAVELPPHKFDQPHPALAVTRLPVAEVDRACRDRHADSFAEVKNRLIGCAEIGDGKKPCRMIVPTRGSMPERERRRVLRHETAHCNGWPADHPH